MSGFCKKEGDDSAARSWHFLYKCRLSRADRLFIYKPVDSLICTRTVMRAMGLRGRFTCLKEAGGRSVIEHWRDNKQAEVIQDYTTPLSAAPGWSMCLSGGVQCVMGRTVDGETTSGSS